ncbi:uncharacterized protein DUF5133 [Streptomyces sp. Amel2xB2]|uniref:DUF5133 domain-containing protein n=1 Tax=Streptomyces sp. Amel2xB2 TaxID=1305829 RepID=UPI000DB9BF7B|nr:DUF5133 domain-containing protein [Streptomyces sp. Amel2xB2]RAJ58834.1 uncharacterized protein DUF5133 [Streptomyces sp. Amel2xB2]
MLKAHPAVLRDLLTRYETLRDAADDGADEGAESRRRLEDVSYTLCILTGTRHIDAAVSSARDDLARRGARDATTTPVR